MTRDHYSTLGVTPSADEVVIHAAYRALMRRYHPDSSAGAGDSDRVRDIAAAYAVLRDPERRSDYDRSRSASDPLLALERGDPQPPPAERPAGRNVAIVAIVASVLAVAWAWTVAPPVPAPAAIEAPGQAATSDLPIDPAGTELSAAASLAEPAPASPVERNPMLAEIAEIVRPPAAAAASPPTAAGQPRPAATPARRNAPLEAPRTCSGMECAGERIGALDRHRNLLFAQSLVSADDSRRELLEANRDSFLARRGACRSEACVAGAYLDHLREVSAIMELGAAARP